MEKVTLSALDLCEHVHEGHVSLAGSSLYSLKGLLTRQQLSPSLSLCTPGGFRTHPEWPDVKQEATGSTA